MYRLIIKIKYLTFCLLLTIFFAKCKKNEINVDLNNGSQTNIISTDTSLFTKYLIDTITIGTYNKIDLGYVFSYDNLNRVKTAHEYEYFDNLPLYTTRLCTFNYSGNDSLPQSLNLEYVSLSSYEKFKIYFFYNLDKTKNRDSIINLNTPTQKFIRKFYYGINTSNNNYVLTKFTPNVINSYMFNDSASFQNNLCTQFTSRKIQTFSSDYYERYVNLKYDSTANPLTKLNIFPALFMSNYLLPGNHLDDFMTNNNYYLNFNFKNNPKRFENYTYSGASQARLSSTSYSIIYDNKNRILKNNYVDSSNNTLLNFRFINFKYKF